MSHGYTIHNHRCCDEAKPSQRLKDVSTHRCGGPRLCEVCSKDAARLHAEAEPGRLVTTLEHNLLQPRLGLATTEHLLQELMCRGYIQTFADENQASGRVLHDECKKLLDELPPAMRAYRTVDPN